MGFGNIFMSRAIIYTPKLGGGILMNLNAGKYEGGRGVQGILVQVKVLFYDDRFQIQHLFKAASLIN